MQPGRRVCPLHPGGASRARARAGRSNPAAPAQKNTIKYYYCSYYKQQLRPVPGPAVPRGLQAAASSHRHTWAGAAMLTSQRWGN